MLNRASAGKLKLLEKDDQFTAGDVANYLCVMLLMLSAANRQKGRDFLRMFRDSGRYPTFFPDGDDLLGDGRLLEQHPDLERTSDDGPVRHSLFNLFKMLRPVVVLDEAHKAYGAKDSGANQEFVRSVNRLDPGLVIELSATPNGGISNLLVDITGVELKDEEMIKLPVQVSSFTIFHPDQALFIDKTLLISWFAHRISDVVPNPWQATRLAQEMVARWQSVGSSDADIHDRRSYIAWRLREEVVASLDLQAQQAFQAKLKKGELSFDLQASRPNFRMKESYEIDIRRLDAPLTRYGQQLQLSLFEPVFDREFDSDLERNFALYLDEQKALKWWHRVAVRQRGDYYLRGWRQERIWPDFVALASRNGAKPHVLVFETKGEHLKGNPDTEYKQKVLETLQSAFNCGTMTIKDGPAKGTFRLVFNANEFPETMVGLEGVYST